MDRLRSPGSLLLLLAACPWTPAQICLPGATSAADVGLSPRCGAVLAWNGDALPDLALADTSGSRVYLLQNDGAGSFFEADSWYAGGDIHDLVACDMDGDGDQDLVVSYPSAAGIAVLFQDASRDFFPGPSAPVPAFPLGLACGDLNGDMVPDVVVASGGYPGSLSVLRNLGAGNFAPATSYAAFGDRTVSCTLLDLDGDLDLDVVGVNEQSASLVLYRNDGSGALTFLALVPVDPGPTFAEAGDLDGDLDLDLVVGCGDFGALTADLLVLQNLGTGAFAAPHRITAPGEYRAASLVDLDGDLLLDLVATYTQGFGKAGRGLLHLRGLGDGTFDSLGAARVAEEPYFVATADFDADGDPDTAVVCDRPGSVVWFDNPGDGRLVDPEWRSGIHHGDVLALDLDQDGHEDLVMVEPLFGGPDYRGIYLQRSVGPSQWGAPESHDTLRYPAEIHAADLDADGDVDLVVSCEGYFDDLQWIIIESGVTVQENLGDGSFAPPLHLLTGLDHWIRTATVADFSGDGIPDIVASGTLYGVPATYLLVHDGAFGFAGPVPILGTLALRLTHADLDGNGAAELLVNPSYPDDDEIRVHVQEGGVFTLRQSIDLDQDLRDWQVVDLGGDGHQDLVTLGVTFSRSQVQLLCGVGDGTLSLPVSLPTAPFASRVAAVHLDDDCALDLVSLNSWTADLWVYPGLGGGNFAAPFSRHAPERPTSMAVLDIDRDGIRELAVGTLDGDVDPTTNGFTLFRFCAMAPPGRPVVDSISPPRGPHEQPATVTVSGQHFHPAASVSVRIGAQPASSWWVVDAQTLHVDLPPLPPGPALLSVQNCVGTTAAAAVWIATPAVTVEGDFQPGGSVKQTYHHEPGEDLLGVFGLPPEVSIPVAPFAGSLRIFPFFLQFIRRDGAETEWVVNGNIPPDPGLQGVEVLFQALVGPTLTGPGKSGAWTNAASLRIE